MTPVTLELGGKDAFIVFDDCDYNHVSLCLSSVRLNFNHPLIPVPLVAGCWLLGDDACVG